LYHAVWNTCKSAYCWQHSQKVIPFPAKDWHWVTYMYLQSMVEITLEINLCKVQALFHQWGLVTGNY
jgi:hypothetical protein